MIVKRNVIANLFGSGWVALISIAFIHLYIHFMGMESYGLVGPHLTLQTLFAVLDMDVLNPVFGVASMCNRLRLLSAAEQSAWQMIWYGCQIEAAGAGKSDEKA